MDIKEKILQVVDLIVNRSHPSDHSSEKVVIYVPDAFKFEAIRNLIIEHQNTFSLFGIYPQEIVAGNKSWIMYSGKHVTWSQDKEKYDHKSS